MHAVPFVFFKQEIFCKILIFRKTSDLWIINSTLIEKRPHDIADFLDIRPWIVRHKLLHPLCFLCRIIQIMLIHIVAVIVRQAVSRFSEKICNSLDWIITIFLFCAVIRHTLGKIRSVGMTGIAFPLWKANCQTDCPIISLCIRPGCRSLAENFCFLFRIVVCFPPAIRVFRTGVYFQIEAALRLLILAD